MVFSVLLLVAALIFLGESSKGNWREERMLGFLLAQLREFCGFIHVFVLPVLAKAIALSNF